ncbi:MAG: hypothetical protein IJU48_02260, partial [Synergistaceae bacterium]|nr:hypothetical protein [Synergistaceae bacterium]
MRKKFLVILLIIVGAVLCAVKFSPSISAFISRITYTYTPNADINDAFWTNSYNFYTQSPNGYYLG